MAEGSPPLFLRARYAVGAIATGVFSATPSTLLLYFCTEHLNLSPAIAALVLFVPKAWAIVLDPLIGAASDRADTRWGRRAPFLAVGGLGMAVAFAALFALPQPGASAWLVGLLYFALATLYSVFAVPFITIPAEVSDDPRVRESLNAWRMSFAMLGILIGAGLAPYLVAWSGGGSVGYARMALLLALACGAAALGAASAARQLEPNRLNTDNGEFTTRLTHVLRDPAFVALALAYILQIAAVGVFSALAPYYVTISLGRSESDTGGILAVMLIAALVSMPVWHMASKRLGALTTLYLAAVVYAASLLALLAFSGGAALLGALATLGAGFGGLQLIPFALLAHLAHTRAQEGAGSSGAYTGAWTASEKLGLALGPAIAALGLSLIGHEQGATTSTVENDTMRALVVLAPVGILTLSSIGLIAFARVNPSPVRTVEGSSL